MTVACALASATTALAAAPVLTPVTGSPFAVGGYPLQVAFSPSGQLLAATNFAQGTVSMLTVGSDGGLSPVAGSPFAPPSRITPLGVAFSPSGGLLATSESEGAGAVSMFSVGSGGPLTQVTGSPFSVATPISIAFSPSGGLLASLDQGGPTVSMHSVGAGGALTSLGSPVSTGAGTTPIQVVFSPSGNLLATADWSDQVSVFSVGAGGSLTPVAGSPFTTNGDTFSVAFSPSGDLLATADNIPTGDGGFAGVVSVFAVGSGGALTQVPGSPFTTGDNPVSVAFSPDGTLLATANASGTVSVFSAGSDGSLDPAPGSPVSVGANLNPLEVVFSPSGGLVAVPLGENDQGVAMFAVTEPATGYVDSTAPPKLEGKAAPGHRLIATSGAWKTSSRLKFAFHWALCTAATDQGCTPLAGGTGRLSPRLTSSAAGSYITVVVSATNATSQSAQAYASEQVDSASTSRARR